MSGEQAMTKELEEAKARLTEALANPLANTTLVYSGYGVRIADLRTLLSALSRPIPSREEMEEALREAFLAGADQDHATGALANIYARNTVDALFHGEKA